MSVGPYAPYRRTLLSGDEVRELSRLRPARPLIDIGLLWAQILVAWTAVAIWPRWWVVLLAFVVIGTRYYALFIIGHDGMHRRLHPRWAVNDLIADLLIFAPIGAITRINKRNHLLHHRHLASEEDPDRHKHSCLNKNSRTRLIAFLTGLLSLVPVVNAVFVRAGEENAEADERGGLLGPYRPRDVLLLLGWQAALIAGLTLAIGWWAYPLLWLAPVYVHAYLGDLARAFIEHAHPESDAAADEHRLITHHSNLVERTFLAPSSMNFHTVHHLWPSIPYYRLAEADATVRARSASEGLEWRGSYLASLWRYWRALPIADCREQSSAQPMAT